MKDNDDYVPRSVRLADVIVILTSLLNNIFASLQAFTEEILELAVYNASRETKISRAWEQFTADLEKMEEENG